MLLKAIIGVLALAVIGAVIGLVTVYQNIQAYQSSLSLTRDELEATRTALDNSKKLNQGLSEANEQLVIKIQEQVQQKLHLEAINSDLTTESRRIYQEVQRVEELNTTLDQDIRAVNAKNNSLNRENHTLVARNNQVEADNESLRHELELAVENARSLQEQNDQQAQDILALEQERSTLQADVKNLEDQSRILDEKNNRQASTIQALEQEKTRLTADVTELRGQNQSLTQLYETYRSKHGTLNQLNSRIDSLRAEISRLEEQRKPLLVESFRTTFRCTGSMEPKITCLDSATLLKNFLPQDITSGTVVSFRPTAACEPTGSRVLHRVVKTKVEKGIYYYWPKGDNNSVPDGCWVPESSVYGYVIELHKNTHLQNAELRNSVNSADAAAERAWDAYQSRRASYGCSNPNRVCTVSSTSRFNELSRLRAEYIAASAYHQCWVQAAKNAWYPRYGKPVFPICIK